jgi:hypothetical protein
MKVLETSSEIKLNNVLFATDFSRYSDAALPFALRLLISTGKTLRHPRLGSDSYLFAVPRVGTQSWRSRKRWTAKDSRSNCAGCRTRF